MPPPPIVLVLDSRDQPLTCATQAVLPIPQILLSTPDPRPPTADPRPPTADRRPRTADRGLPTSANFLLPKSLARKYPNGPREWP
ncbi:MAG: hypothetical protein ACKV19_16265 [Verrucomicrobiales bacterium]